MTRYRKSWTEVIKEVYLGEALKPADKKVVDSFYDKEVNDNGKILSTNGVDLFKMGIGGQPIATWKKGKIQIVAKMDVKSTESIIKYMKKSIPSGLFEEVEIDEKFAGWIAFYNKKKLEIKPKKGEIDSLYDAKQAAIKHFKVPKSKQGLLAIEPAHEEVEEARTYLDRKDEKKKKGFTPQSQKKKRWGSGGYGKGEEAEVDEAVNLKKLKKEYEDNEDKNYHRENYLLLAKAFGTRAEIKKVEEIIARSEKQGHTSKKDNDWMYKNINPYYDKIRNEEVELSEKGTAYPATVDTLKMIVKDKQHQTVMFDKGNAKVDLFTASAMMAVYNALKQPALKKKFEDMIKSKEGFMQTQAFAMKMAK